MKKGILVFATILLVLLFFLAPAVDAGVGNSESGGSSLIDSGGGSSWSGGDSWSGGSSSYSSGSGSGSSGSFAVVVIGGVIGLLYNLVKGTDDTSSSNNELKRTTEERAGKPIQNNLEAIRQLKQQDPNFDEERFLSQVKVIYLRLQSAWTEKDWASVRGLESPSLYDQHSTQL